MSVAPQDDNTSSSAWPSVVEGWDFCCGGDVFALELRELVGDAPMRYLRYIRYNRYNRYIEPHNRKSVATLPA